VNTLVYMHVMSGVMAYYVSLLALDNLYFPFILSYAVRTDGHTFIHAHLISCVTYKFLSPLFLSQATSPDVTTLRYATPHSWATFLRVLDTPVPVPCVSRVNSARALTYKAEI